MGRLGTRSVGRRICEAVKGSYAVAENHQNGFTRPTLRQPCSLNATTCHWNQRCNLCIFERGGRTMKSTVKWLLTSMVAVSLAGLPGFAQDPGPAGPQQSG